MELGHQNLKKVWERIVKKYKLPFVTSWTGMDVLSTNNSSNLELSELWVIGAQINCFSNQIY